MRRATGQEWTDLGKRKRTERRLQAQCPPIAGRVFDDRYSNRTGAGPVPPLPPQPPVPPWVNQSLTVYLTMSRFQTRRERRASDGPCGTLAKHSKRSRNGLKSDGIFAVSVRVAAVTFSVVFPNREIIIAGRPCACSVFMMPNGIIVPSLSDTQTSTTVFCVMTLFLKIWNQKAAPGPTSVGLERST